MAMSLCQPVVATLKTLAKALEQTAAADNRSRWFAFFRAPPSHDLIQARRIRADVEETEAIMAGYWEGILDETRLEFRGQQQAASGAGGGLGGAPTKSKAAKRKQQKRKAQQQKKAAEMAEAAVATTAEAVASGADVSHKSRRRSSRSTRRGRRGAREQLEPSHKGRGGCVGSGGRR